MLIIGFGNKSRQGKDTAAEAIRDHYAINNRLYANHFGAEALQIKVRVIKFADTLYQETNDYLEIGRNLGIPPVELFKKGIREVVGGEIVTTPIPEWVVPDPSPEVNRLAPYGKHPKLLQFWGTEFRRAQDPDYWVKKTFANIPKNADIVMITDVRFPNEADAVKQQGGYTVNVQRLRDDGQLYYSSDRPADHISEIALDGYNWDFYIKTKEGHAALTAEMAITLAEYLRGLQSGKA